VPSAFPWLCLWTTASSILWHADFRVVLGHSPFAAELAVEKSEDVFLQHIYLIHDLSGYFLIFTFIKK